MKNNVRTEYWYKLNLGVDIHLKAYLLTVLHNQTNDQIYDGLPQDEGQLCQLMATFKRLKQRKLKNVIRADQWNLLCPASGRAKSEQWDTTLIIVVIINLLEIPQLVLDIIKEARIVRNKTKHISLGDVQSEQQFKPLWCELRDILVRGNYTNIADFDDLGAGALRFYTNAIVEFLGKTQEVLKSDLEAQVQDLNDNTETEVFLLQKQLSKLKAQCDNLQTVIENQEASIKITEEKQQEFTSNLVELNRMWKLNEATLLNRYAELEDRVTILEGKKPKTNFDGVIVTEVVEIISQKLSRHELKNFIHSTKPGTIDKFFNFISRVNRLEYLQRQKLTWQTVKHQLLEMDRKDVINLITSTSNITKEFEAAVGDFKKYIQRNYLQSSFVKPFLGRCGDTLLEDKNIEELYVDLAVIKDQDVDEKTFLSDREYHLHLLDRQKEFISLEEISGISDQFLFIQGVSGIGKSTLVKKLVSEWCKDRLFNGENGGTRIHLLIPILCRKLNNFDILPHENADDLLQRLFPQIPDLKVLQKNGCRILLIIDGVDELRDIRSIGDPNRHPAVNLIYKALDPDFIDKIQSIVVGRPHIINFLHSFCKSNFCYQPKKIEVCGFNKKNVKKYVYKQFNDSTIAIKVLEKIQMSHVTRNLCTIPLYLQVLVSISKDNPFTKPPSRASEILLYSILVFFRNQRQKQNPLEAPISLGKFVKNEKFANYIKGMSKFAYNTIIKNEIIFEARESGDLKELEEMGIILKSARGETDVDVYQFLHLTFQELFAAFYILCDKEPLDFGNPILRDVIVIAAGIQGISHGNGDLKNSLLFLFLQDIKREFQRNIMDEVKTNWIQHLPLSEVEQRFWYPKALVFDAVFENQPASGFTYHSCFDNKCVVAPIIDLVSQREKTKFVEFLPRLVNDNPSIRIRKMYISTSVIECFGEKNMLNVMYRCVCMEFYSLSRGSGENLFHQFTDQVKSGNVALEWLRVQNVELSYESLATFFNELCFPCLDIISTFELSYKFHEDCKSLLKSLSNRFLTSHSLRVVTMRWCSLTDDLFLVLLDSIENLDSIDVSTNKLSQLSLYRLLKRLNSKSRLKHVIFSHNDFANKHFDEIDPHEIKNDVTIDCLEVCFSEERCGENALSQILPIAENIAKTLKVSRWYELHKRSARTSSNNVG